jgi:hypothetical protein
MKSLEGEWPKKIFTPESSKEKLPDNVVVLERPEARYRIIYETHTLPHSPEEFGSPDAIALELVSTGEYRFDNKEAAEKTIIDFWNLKLKQAPADKKTEAAAELNYIKGNNIPLYLMDIIDPTFHFTQQVKFYDQLLKSAEIGAAAGAAGYIGYKLARKKLRDEPMTRRDFLKLTGAGMASAYFGTQILDDLVESSYAQRVRHTKLSGAARALQGINEKIHPETEGLILTLRNALWAQKLEAIAGHLTNKLGRRPEIAVRVGAYHVGIEDMLQEPSHKRSNSLKRFIGRFGNPGEDVSFSDIARIEFSQKDNKWVATDIFKEPVLEEIEKSLPEKK